MKAPLYPPPLQKGDRIGIVAPAGQLQDPARLIRGVAILEQMGFQVKFPANLWPGHHYLADNDKNRAEEFNRLIRDDDIKGLICLRGGYGCLRMLDKIDLAAVARRPKIVAGFSDITILQNFLYAQTGLVCLHGPVITALDGATEECLAHFNDRLRNIVPPRIVSKQIEVLRSGRSAAAPLIGGNLASLVSFLGTPYDFSWDDKIVFLEDINEPTYKIDRMLTQLQLAGKLDKIAGLILGDFSMSACTKATEISRYRDTIWKRILELCADLSAPIWANFPSGHCPANLSFPLGATAVMESAANTLIFD